MNTVKKVGKQTIMINALQSYKTEQPTPMMQQYLAIKANHIAYLLFYRMGDFYELFFEDAVIASRTLGITLTKRGKHLSQDIPMCGVPIHAADDYLQKLIVAGFRVAVCEQIEDASLAKKRGAAVLQRDVVRLITPGTLTEDRLLDPVKANYLMALTEVEKKDGDGFALAWIDISTGIFRVTSTRSANLLAEIVRIDPQELIVSEKILYNEKYRDFFDALRSIVLPQPDEIFETRTAKNRIAHYYHTSTIDKSFEIFSCTEYAAISAALAYIEKTQIGVRPILMQPEREIEQSRLFIDPATRQNLELLRTLSGKQEGSLIRSMDKTMTGGGSRLLAERLVSPLIDPQDIEKRLDSVCFFIRENALCTAVREDLKGLPDMPRALSRLAVGRGGPRDFASIMQGLLICHKVSILFSSFILPTELHEILKIINQFPIYILQHLDSALAENLPLLKRDGGFIRDGYHTELDEQRGLRNKSRKIIASLQSQYAKETGIKTLKIKHNNILGFFIEITATYSEFLEKTFEIGVKFIHRQTLANTVRFTTPELIEIESRITGAAEKALILEYEIFDQLTSEIVAAADLLRSVFLSLCTIDVSAALAVLAEDEGYCRPKIDNSFTFNIVAGRHPIVEQALRQQAKDPFIANDCYLSPKNKNGLQNQNSDLARKNNQGMIWLLTGPNMGGKSTFLRQNALIVIMAQMGSFVPAGSAHIGVIDRLFSRVGASDDLANGRSTFMVEMMETATILNQASQRSLVILDEIGRGTSTFDGLSIAWATLEHLHEINQCRAIFATHFHELTVLDKKLSHLHNYTMVVREWNGEVIFMHEIREGTADRSYGVQVAQLAGLPKTVISRAQNILQQLERGGIILQEDTTNQEFSFSSFTPSEPTILNAYAINNFEQRILNVLENIEPDQLSPKQALEELYKIKNLFKSQNNTSSQ